MVNDIKSVIARAGTTLLSDTLGVLALMIMLIVGLALPSLI